MYPDPCTSTMPEAQLKPIDTCNCPSHTIERAQRELTLALRNLVSELDRLNYRDEGRVVRTNPAYVEAVRTLEVHGYKEKGE